MSEVSTIRGVRTGGTREEPPFSGLRLGEILDEKSQLHENGRGSNPLSTFKQGIERAVFTCAYFEMRRSLEILRAWALELEAAKRMKRKRAVVTRSERCPWAEIMIQEFQRRGDERELQRRWGYVQAGQCNSEGRGSVVEKR